MVQYFTKSGLEKLKEELADLKKNKIPEVKKLIAEARAFGDLKENAGYHDARDKMSFLLGRIEQLECAINEAVVCPASARSFGEARKVDVGSRVIISFGDEKQEYELVGPTEAEILKNKISYQSPLGQELMGKKTGDTFKFGPKSVSIKILKIK
jgi:transcription elongation factor GreA